MGKPTDSIQTRASLRKQAFLALVSQLEPKRINEAMEGESWRQTMKEELDQFKRNKEGIDYDETFAPIARLESKTTAPKKLRRNASGSLSPKDVQFFWGIEQKNIMCSLEIFEEAIRLFYANLCISPYSGEMETLVIGSRIIINELLFEDVFGAKFFGVVPYMNGVCPDDFEVSLEGAKRTVVELDSDLPVVGPLSLCFEHRILAHIVATTLIPRKGSLSSISTQDVFILYSYLRNTVSIGHCGSRNIC
ncbi:hypothetical protein KY284_016642 [Solanum tuberosum]|nr:hypothetical protein KY284_016642 [Solanum tuberosum]